MQLGVVGSRLVGLPAKGSFCFSKGYWIPNCVPLSQVPLLDYTIPSTAV